MHIRKRSSFLCAALLLGLSLGAGWAHADTSTGKEPGKGAKGKTGDTCKTDSDCDQSSQPHTCTAGKCQVHRPPPPTT